MIDHVAAAHIAESPAIVAAIVEAAFRADGGDPSAAPRIDTGYPVQVVVTRGRGITTTVVGCHVGGEPTGSVPVMVTRVEVAPGSTHYAFAWLTID